MSRKRLKKQERTGGLFLGVFATLLGIRLPALLA
jgi:hypothetical protein